MVGIITLYIAKGQHSIHFSSLFIPYPHYVLFDGYVNYKHNHNPSPVAAEGGKLETLPAGMPQCVFVSTMEIFNLRNCSILTMDGKYGLCLKPLIK